MSLDTNVAFVMTSLTGFGLGGRSRVSNVPLGFCSVTTTGIPSKPAALTYRIKLLSFSRISVPTCPIAAGLTILLAVLTTAGKPWITGLNRSCCKHNHPNQPGQVRAKSLRSSLVG